MAGSPARVAKPVLLCFAALVGGASLRAASADGDGGVGVGGEVASTISIGVDNISPSWRTAPHRHGAYVRTVRVEATATQGGTWLTITDGDAASGRRHGRLVLHSAPLHAPLLASAGGPYESLADRVDPVLLRWRRPIATAPARIRLLQTASKALRPDADKQLMITLIAGGP